MTCIVAGVDKETRTNYIACDSCFSFVEDDVVIPASGSKLWRCGPFVLGLCGRTRDMQAFVGSRTKFHAPKKQEPVDWLIAWLLKAAKKTHRLKDGDDDPAIRSEILASGLGAIYMISCDFSCSKLDVETYAIGSGGQFANGALSVARMFAVPVRDAMGTALTVAHQHVPGSVAPPWHFLEASY